MEPNSTQNYFEKNCSGISLQEKYAKKSICFGCGPSNEKGLKIGSFYPNPEEALSFFKSSDPLIESKKFLTIALFNPETYQEAFPGMVNGGIIGSLLDCHSNWTAAHFLMLKTGRIHPPCTVTGDFHVKLKRPTPSNGPLYLKAWVMDESKEDRALIGAELIAIINGVEKVCATCEGNFIEVKEGHPAYHRW